MEELDHFYTDFEKLFNVKLVSAVQLRCIAFHVVKDFSSVMIGIRIEHLRRLSELYRRLCLQNIKEPISAWIL